MFFICCAIEFLFRCGLTKHPLDLRGSRRFFLSHFAFIQYPHPQIAFLAIFPKFSSPSHSVTTVTTGSSLFSTAVLANHCKSHAGALRLPLCFSPWRKRDRCWGFPPHCQTMIKKVSRLGLLSHSPTYLVSWGTSRSSAAPIDFWLSRFQKEWESKV